MSSSSKPTFTEYEVIILCGHPGSGKTALARSYAANSAKPVKVLSTFDLVHRFLAELCGVDESNFKNPNDALPAFEGTDGNPISFGEFLEDYYNYVRTLFRWDIWVARLQRLISEELKTPDGARTFVVDDIVHNDECEYLSVFPGSKTVVVFLGKNQGNNPVHTTHTTFHSTRCDILASPGVITLRTDALPGETHENSLLRCVNLIKTRLESATVR